jgi:prepilin-type N-terminal cleavage/methylation domain-containing protein
MRSRPNRRQTEAGFTLVELSIVILIIGILTSFLLVVSYEGTRRANERATQALIMKLDTAIGDRLAALQTRQAPVNNGHRYLAMSVVPTPTVARYLESEERAQLIANIDYLRRELPDVFFVQDDANYPLNFAGVPFTVTGMGPAPSPALGVTGTLAPYANVILPIGNSIQLAQHYDQRPEVTTGVGNPTYRTFAPADLTATPPRTIELLGQSEWNRHPLAGDPVTYRPAGEGIFGASYSAIAALTKQLGYAPIGTNGVDDDGDGLIDELDGEGDGGDPVLNAQILQRLANHRHDTARSEVLYALLVEGQGPLGSIFSSDDFTSREVADTDGDGLLEFIDSWGKPLQFFRWPLYYTTERAAGRSFLKGPAPYSGGPSEVRQDNPLDPNRYLMAPAWWANLSMTLSDPASTSSLISPRANLFSRLFFSVVDAGADDGNAAGFDWDRTGTIKRRAYFSKFLIASGGADLHFGLGLFGVDYSELDSSMAPSGIDVPVPVAAADTTTMSTRINLIESQAGTYDPVARAAAANAGGAGLHQGLTGSFLSDALANNWASDDIANLTVRSAASGAR